MWTLTSCRIAFAGLLAGLAFFLAPVVAGELEPPVPPGTPTMKPLDAIEPRRPITADMLPLTITERGSSWYLTGDIVAVGGGISVQADAVTIDLMGFSLGGGTGVGIEADTREGLTVRNGRIAGWTATCILPGFRSLLENLTVKGCGGSGIVANFDSMIVDTMAANNSVHGIIVKAGGMVRGCRAVNNTENGIWVEEENNRVGGMVTGCLVKGNLRNGIRIDGYATVTDNQVLDNGGIERAGIWVYGSNNRVEGNTVMNNNIGIEIDGSYNMITRNYVGSSFTSNFDIDTMALMNLVIVEHVWNTTPHDPWANIETP
jgi:parallel beta-helix repeat protein